MMNVSDNTRLSNTIHRSSITKYVLLDAQQIWPAQCNNARLFTVVHYLCKVFECIYPTILSHNIQITTYTLYTYEPPERLPPESQIYSSIGGRPVHTWPRNGKMDVQCLKTDRIAHGYMECYNEWTDILRWTHSRMASVPFWLWTMDEEHVLLPHVEERRMDVWWLKRYLKVLRNKIPPILTDLLPKTGKLCSGSSTLSDRTDRAQFPYFEGQIRTPVFCM